MSEKTVILNPGDTWFGGAPDSSTDCDKLLGAEFERQDVARGTGRIVRYRVVRNSAGFAVLPGRVAQLSADGRTITGYAIDGIMAGRRCVVDDQLPAAGCAANDICLVCIKGPQLVRTALSDVAADYTGALLNPITAATTGATTAGRVKPLVIAAATADATAGQRNATEWAGVFAQAISAGVTNSTNNQLLVEVSPY